MIALFALGLTNFAKWAADRELRAVPQVDLQRYTGTWYEVARYANRFQRSCNRDTTATYTLRDDGKIKVVNACRTKQGNLKKIEGTARIADRTSNAKLKVTFFWPFYGNYWIIDLDPEYKYAVVGEPSRKYLWILSRTPAMSDAQYEQITRKIAGTGYDPSKLMRTRQSGE
ncbi:MAG: lipocalin family protein [Candidatus Acidiferrales bacterium]|jgi:apolipoprotein D and lipocalin family protein